MHATALAAAEAAAAAAAQADAVAEAALATVEVAWMHLQDRFRLGDHGDIWGLHQEELEIHGDLMGFSGDKIG